MREFRDFAAMVRRIARDVVMRTAPPPEHYKVIRKKPLTLEAFGSDLRLIDGEDGFSVPRGIRQHAKVDESILVGTDVHGDKFIIGQVSAFDPQAKPSGKGKGGGEGGGGGGEGGGGEEGSEAEEGGEVEGGGADEALEGEEATSGIAALAAVTTGGLGVIVHGDDPSVPRETQYPHVLWIGTVAPDNKIDVDLLGIYA